MQTEQNLIELGFVRNGEAQYTYKGVNQTFVAFPILHTPPAYVSLFVVSDLIDERKLSDNYGKNYLNRIKDCCSPDSVKRAISKYDLPFNRLQFEIGGCHILASELY